MEEFNKIRKWAEERGIYKKGDVKTQYLKLVEEVGELSKAILEDDREEFIDAVGDCVVVLTSLAYLGSSHFQSLCPECKGEGGYYEDVASDGGSRMWFDCPECCFGIEHCIESAYDQISKRKGEMKNGTFIKTKNN